MLYPIFNAYQSPNKLPIFNLCNNPLFSSATGADTTAVDDNLVAKTGFEEICRDGCESAQIFDFVHNRVEGKGVYAFIAPSNANAEIITIV
mmetsp:Transcript_17439/g.25221  ORF Transcript_17439/g.25221 Transcript_17439/m.25221 type:complete len:91 (-) Transcript_17439:2409-2681(-)